ncbi:MAG: hypothetical protein JW730_18160 [Anaerolineales bacterium]|nr:hypothetical protein [Anaerolineales bacterium]
MANKKMADESISAFIGLSAMAPTEEKVMSSLLETKRQEWEYLVIVLGEQADLNPYGSKGWELVGLTAHGFNESIYHFKRPRG